MNHNSQDELLSAYLDGELTAEEQAVVEKRLSESAELRQLYDDLRALRVSFESFPTYRLPHDLSQQVLRRAERAMLSNPDLTNPNLAVGNGAADKPILDKPVAEKPDAEKTVAPAPLGGMRLPRGLRPWLWAAATIAAAVLMMVNPERPGKLNERDVAMVGESQKQPADASMSAAPPRGVAGKKAAVDDNSIDGVQTESFALDRRAKLSNRFAEGQAAQEETHLAKELRQSKADGSVMGEVDLADESLDNLKLNEHMVADEYATKRESTAFGKQPADFSRSQAEGLATRSRRNVDAERLGTEKFDAAQQGMLGGEGAGGGAGGFGGGIGNSPAEAKAALVAAGGQHLQYNFGYTAVETEQLAQRLLSTTVLPQGVDRDDVAVVELQITPAAAESGAFYKLLNQNHIAFAGAPALHSDVIKNGVFKENHGQEGVVSEDRVKESAEFGQRPLGKASGAVAGGSTDGRGSAATHSGLALDAAKKSVRAKGGADAAADRKSGNGANAGELWDKVAADKAPAGNKGLASDKAASDKAASDKPTNDKLSGDKPANQRSKSLDRHLAPRGFAGDEKRPSDQESLRELEAASKNQPASDPAFRYDRSKETSRVAAGAGAGQGGVPDAVKLKTSEPGQEFDAKARAGKAGVDAGGADAKMAKSKARDTSDLNGRGAVADMDADGFDDRAETAGVASNWMFGSVSDPAAANLAAVLVEADAADLNSTLLQLHAQRGEFVELAVHSGEGRQSLNFYFEQTPELLGRLSRRGEQSAGDTPVFTAPAPVRAVQDAEHVAQSPADAPARNGVSTTVKQYSQTLTPQAVEERYVRQAPAPSAKQDDKAEVGTKYVGKAPASERPLVERNVADKPASKPSPGAQASGKPAPDKTTPDKRLPELQSDDKKLADTNSSDTHFRAPRQPAQDRAAKPLAAPSQLASDDFVPPSPTEDAPAAAPKTEPAPPAVADDRLESRMRGRAYMLPITPDVLAFQQSLVHDWTAAENAVDQPAAADAALGAPLAKDSIPSDNDVKVGVGQKVEPSTQSAAGSPAQTVGPVPQAAAGPLGGRGAAPSTGAVAPPTPAPPAAKAESSAKGSKLRPAPTRPPVAVRPTPADPGASPERSKQTQVRPKPDLAKSGAQPSADATKSQQPADNAPALPRAQPPAPPLAATESNGQPQGQDKPLPESVVRQQVAPEKPAPEKPIAEKLASEQPQNGASARQRLWIQRQQGDLQSLTATDDEQGEKQQAPAKDSQVEFGDAAQAFGDVSGRQPRYVLFLVRVVDPNSQPADVQAAEGQAGGEVTAESKPAESKPAESTPTEAGSEVQPADPTQGETSPAAAKPTAPKSAPPAPAAPSQRKSPPARPAPARSPRR